MKASQQMHFTSNHTARSRILNSAAKTDLPTP